MSCIFFSKVWYMEQIGPFLLDPLESANSQILELFLLLSLIFHNNNRNYCVLFTYYVPGIDIS